VFPSNSQPMVLDNRMAFKTTPKELQAMPNPANQAGK
jgi:hypothetical protein